MIGTILLSDVILYLREERIYFIKAIMHFAVYVAYIKLHVL